MLGQLPVAREFSMPDPRSRLVAAIAICAVAISSQRGPARAGDDPDDVLRAVYEPVEQACPEDGRSRRYNLAEIAERHFTDELRDLLRSAYEARTIDFDILIDARECAIEDIDLDIRGVREDEEGREVSAVGRAEFRNLGDKRRIEFLIVNRHGEWRVDDIRYKHRNWSLRRDIAYATPK
jgi:hypothetical protein